MFFKKIMCLFAVSSFLFGTGCDAKLPDSGDGAVDENPSGGDGTEGDDEDKVSPEELLILDVVFNNDGSAKDMSPRKKPVQTVKGAGAVTYMNETYGGYVARFNHAPGVGVTDGYYKIDYNGDQIMQRYLKDGHSLEVMFMADFEHDGSKEVKMFGSHQSGGTGFLLTASAQGREIAFLPYVGGQYCWTRSGVVPERGRYYHVVGVWDKEKGEARVYVDGVLKGTVPAMGDLVLPVSTTAKWFGIGCDAGATGEAAWKGDVVLARIYKGALGDEDVARLWKDADKGFAVSDIRVDNVMFLTGCEVKGGSEYMILGNGYRDGDKVLVESVSDECCKVVCDAWNITDDSMAITLPDGLVSGRYKLILSRGTSVCPLGVADLKVVENPIRLKAPKTIAHRCFHKNHPENSMAALAAAQELGVYGAEIDVWITKDGKLVVNHDGVLGGKRLEDFAYDEVKDLKLTNGEPLPLFENMLDKVKGHPGTRLIIEIKDHSKLEREQEAVDAVLEMVTKKGMDDYVEYIAFDYELCKRIVAAKPKAMVGYLGGGKAPEEVFADGIMSIDYQFQNYVSHPEWVREAHGLGMTVNVWTVNSDSDLMTAIVKGVDYITTDAPDRLMEISAKFFE